MNSWIEDSKDYTIDHLKIVKFRNFKGLPAELKLVKFLIGHSPLLETMCIHCSTFMNQGVVSALTEEILQYSKASSRAQIRLEHLV